jgi:hypothetical protein
MKFINQETSNKIECSFKICEEIDTVLSQREKIRMAEKTLEEKISKADDDLKDSLKKAGVIEAQRLLRNDIDAQDFDTKIIAIRDQQVRLRAARQELKAQKAALDEQVTAMHAETKGSLHAVLNAVKNELDVEMRQAADIVISVVNRLYAFAAATKVIHPSEDMLEVNIPSLLHGENLFQKPARYSSVERNMVDEIWKQDQMAVSLRDLLLPLGRAYDAISAAQRSVEDERAFAERDTAKRQG